MCCADPLQLLLAEELPSSLDHSSLRALMFLFLRVHVCLHGMTSLTRAFVCKGLFSSSKARRRADNVWNVEGNRSEAKATDEEEIFAWRLSGGRRRRRGPLAPPSPGSDAGPKGCRPHSKSSPCSSPRVHSFTDSEVVRLEKLLASECEAESLMASLIVELRSATQLSCSQPHIDETGFSHRVLHGASDQHDRATKKSKDTNDKCPAFPGEDCQLMSQAVASRCGSSDWECAGEGETNIKCGNETDELSKSRLSVCP